MFVNVSNGTVSELASFLITNPLTNRESIDLVLKRIKMDPRHFKPLCRSNPTPYRGTRHYFPTTFTSILYSNPNIVGLIPSVPCTSIDKTEDILVVYLTDECHRVDLIICAENYVHSRW